MAVKGNIFGFYETKSLRKNYNIGKKYIINIFRNIKNEKMVENSKMAKLNFLPFFSFLKKLLNQYL